MNSQRIRYIFGMTIFISHYCQENKNNIINNRIRRISVCGLKEVAVVVAASN